MAVSKRLRYEVFKRDNHTCRYCGGAAPDVKITIDHVVPTTLGGNDDPTNLVTACADCNSGKSSSSPDAPLVAEVTEAALRWGRAVSIAAMGMGVELGELCEVREEFLAKWHDWSFGPPHDRKSVPLASDWPDTVRSLLSRGLPLDVLKECVDIAMRRPGVTVDNTYRYFCGVAWRKVTELTDVAKNIYGSWEVER